MADYFDDDATAQLSHDEGSITLVYTLNEPISGPPPQPKTLLETRSSAEVQTTLVVNPRLELVFHRGGKEIELDLAPLHGGRVLFVGLTWGPTELHVYAGAQDLGTQLIRSSTTWQA